MIDYMITHNNKSDEIFDSNNYNHQRLQYISSIIIINAARTFTLTTANNNNNNYYTNCENNHS